MRFLAERGQGFATAGGVVPIVPAAAIFDLVASGGARPGPDDGYAAAVAALRDEPLASGPVGAGRSATVGKSRGAEFSVPGGFGFATVRIPDAEVVAFAVVNAVGDVVGIDGRVLAGTRAPAADAEFTAAVFGENTTLVVVGTDAPLDKLGCHLVAQSAHDGLARAIRPAHTRFDGDLAIALATATAPAQEYADGLLDRVRVAAADATEAAIRSAVGV
jgi:L-aminopeptidase/D-esterase-like protein